MQGSNAASRPHAAGLDRLLADRETIARLAQRQVAMLTNHASMTMAGEPATRALAQRLGQAGGGIARLFTPEHGLLLDTGAGAAVDDGTDPLTGLPVQSLYAADATEIAAELDDIDTLVIDLRDVGVRCYTYAASAARLARQALERHIEVILCDRANPIGPGTEGPRPAPERRSFIAFFDVPFVHGQTIGELLTRYLAPVVGDAPFLVYPADIVLTADLGWTPPSPALPHPDAVAAYAALVLLEGTNVSEGRSSSLSFRSVSAPGLDSERLADAINGWETGFAAAACTVTPMRGEQAGKGQPGAALWPRTSRRQQPLALGVRLLAWLKEHHPDFAWLPGHDGRPGGAIDTLLGRSDLREDIESGADPARIMADWR